MNPEFVQRYAPKLMLKRNATPRAGLDTGIDPEQGTSGGVPRPYIQTQGGPREYFGAPDGLRGRMPDQPYPRAGINMGDEVPPPAFPSIAPTNVPPNGLDLGGLGDRLPVTPPGTEVPQNMLAPRRMSANPSATARIPADSRDGQLMSGIREGRINPMQGREGAIMDRAMNPEGMTLGDLLGQAGFQLPSFLRTAVGGLRGRLDAPNTDQPVVDPRADMQRPTRHPGTTRDRSMFGGRAEEVAAVLRARGIRVTSVTRGGNARPGGHPAGNSIDVDPADRIRAIEVIQSTFPDMPVESFDIRAGQDFGNGVRSTGHHGHIDLGPAAH